jgi:dynein heavy chain
MRCVKNEGKFQGRICNGYIHFAFIGVGKSVIAKGVLQKLSSKGKYVPVSLNFSAQTSSTRAQEIIEMKLLKRKKTLLGPPVGKKIVVFVDDVNMPKLDTYGSQPPIELLR